MRYVLALLLIVSMVVTVLALYSKAREAAQLTIRISRVHDVRTEENSEQFEKVLACFKSQSKMNQKFHNFEVFIGVILIGLASAGLWLDYRREKCQETEKKP